MCLEVLMAWEITVEHEGLNKFRVIRGKDEYVVQQKANAQLATWNEMWEKKQADEHKRLEKEGKAQEREANKELAQGKTKEAEEVLESLRNTLKFTLDVNDVVDWEKLKDHSKFSKKPSKPAIDREPDKSEQKYNPNLGLLDKIIPSRKKRKLEDAELIFKKDHAAWITKKNAIEKSYDEKIKKWEEEKEEFLKKQAETNKRIDENKTAYFNKEPSAIYDYCDLVLTNSQYPDYFPQEFNLDYNPNNGILIVDYSLPDIEDIPKLKEVKYIQAKNEFKEIYISDAELRRLYDDLLYQIALRSIHELYEADVVDALKSIVFNGWVKFTDKATGKKVNSCILSVQAEKEQFLEINLAQVDPKACFKSLKGVGSAKLSSLTPIAPILRIDKEDKRFISSYDVTGDIDETSNLAAMDWEDFEHLIRELFEKEFTQSGGEVKVTQASRDGGVDAIAFDPDPIRGGKIVIQAKRYTNVVGVSAVRDLYGTVVNEGATKGILVTTADYGPDAYEFAKGKPLTLLNGGNLLHLLEKHGHKAKIDLKEAKKILSEKESNRQK